MAKHKKNHKLEGEIRKKSGAYKKVPMALATDVRATLKTILDKYKGKLTLDAMHRIVDGEVFLAFAYEIAFAAS